MRNVQTSDASIFSTACQGFVSFILPMMSSLFGLFVGWKSAVARNGKKLTKYYEKRQSIQGLP